MREDHSFPTEERIHHKKEYDAVFTKGDVRHGAHLVAFLLRRPGLERKLGVVAGKRVGNAVRRNRSKRLLREAYRGLKPRLPAEGFHLVLVARRGLHTAPLSLVQKELTGLLSDIVSD